MRLALVIPMLFIFGVAHAQEVTVSPVQSGSVAMRLSDENIGKDRVPGENEPQKLHCDYIDIKHPDYFSQSEVKVAVFAKGSYEVEGKNFNDAARHLIAHGVGTKAQPCISLSTSAVNPADH